MDHMSEYLYISVLKVVSENHLYQNHLKSFKDAYFAIMKKNQLYV